MRMVQVGVMEHNGAVFRGAGLDVAALKRHHAATGSLCGFPGADRELGPAAAADMLFEPSVPAHASRTYSLAVQV